MRMGGKPAPFGIDEEQIDAVIERIIADPYLEFRGIHLFTGTQILDPAVLIRQYRKGIEIAVGVAGGLNGRCARWISAVVWEFHTLPMKKNWIWTHCGMN